MSLIAPFSLLLGLLALPIILLYMLRLRRREVKVSSTMLWQHLLRDREANTPWQRLRRNLLMLVQLLILALLVFTLARPFLPVPSVTRGSVVVLLDGSASMLAREGETDRFSLAQAEVERIINRLESDAQMTLILVGATPQVLAAGSHDRPTLRQALAQASAAPEVADWSAALALAAGAAQGYEDGRIVLVSDGGLPQDLPALTAETVFVPVGDAVENLGISALAARDGPDGVRLFAAVTNYGRMPQRSLFNLSLDGRLFDARWVDVGGGERTSLSWDLPGEPEVIGARLTETGNDNLRVDDAAWAVHEGGTHRRVLLFSEGNRFLETALSLLPGTDVVHADPAEPFPLGGVEPFDLYVIDSVPIPADLPAADLLLINPQSQSGSDEETALVPLEMGGVFSNTDVIRIGDNPLLRFVDWSHVNVRDASAINAPWATPLVTAEGGPLLLAGERGGHRAVILTFRLQESDLPLQIAFPILMANIMDWLDPGSVLKKDAGHVPGDPVRITADADAEVIVVRKPDGTAWIREVEEPEILFPETNQPGVYEVLSRVQADERLAGRFAVNVMSPVESSIAPTESVRLGSFTLEKPGDGSVGRQELWPWLAAATVMFVLIEWWIYHRGARLPRRDDWRTLLARDSGKRSL